MLISNKRGVFLLARINAITCLWRNFSRNRQYQQGSLILTTACLECPGDSQTWPLATHTLLATDPCELSKSDHALFASIPFPSLTSWDEIFIMSFCVVLYPPFLSRPLAQTVTLCCYGYQRWRAFCTIMQRREKKWVFNTSVDLQ